ncbi:MAG: hypothetical protein ACPG7F_00295 [Aggregatilineales bacterium]
MAAASPEWMICPVSGGYIVAWRDAAGAYADFTDDEPIRLWYRLYREYKNRAGWRLALLRLLHPVDTQEFVALGLQKKEEVAGV